MTITRRCVELLGTDVVFGGLVTLEAQQVEPRAYRAVWAAQSRGVGLKMVKGWIIRGYHSCAKTLERAKREAQAARRRAAETTLAQRLSLTDIDLTKVYVRRSDSNGAGNCAAGTANFIKIFRHHIGEAEHIRADELLRLRNDSYVRRAILQAYARMQVSEAAPARPRRIEAHLAEASGVARQPCSGR